MISITPFASSSRGNCYGLTDGTTPLLLEAGVPVRKLRRLATISKIAGCLVTHNHGDHAVAVKDLTRAGISCYMSAGTAEAIGVSNHRVRPVAALKQFTIGSWKILPFEAVHDAAEPLSFLLQSGQDKVLFATDTAYIKHRFKGLTQIMIECNYHYPSLIKSIESGYVTISQKNRLLKSHLSLDNVVEFLKANDLSAVQGIWLLHLSDSNSDEQHFKKTIQELTGKPVTVCKEY